MHSGLCLTVGDERSLIAILCVGTIACRLRCPRVIVGFGLVVCAAPVLGAATEERLAPVGSRLVGILTQVGTEVDLVGGNAIVIIGR